MTNDVIERCAKAISGSGVTSPRSRKQATAALAALRPGWPVRLAIAVGMVLAGAAKLFHW
jgi:hypothetical protein